MLVLAFICYGLLLAAATIWMKAANLNLAPSMVPEPQLLLYGCGVGIATASVSYLMVKYGRSLPVIRDLVEFAQTRLAPLMSVLTMFDIVVMAVISGFCEEIFFRGVIQNLYGLVGASILFGFVHFPGVKYIAYVAFATLAGFLYGYLYIRTGNLWVPIMGHIIHNLISLSLLKLFYKPTEPLD